MKISNELKQQILNEYYDSEGGTVVFARKYNISFHTIDTWIYKQQHGVDIYKNNRLGRSGHPKTKKLIRILLKHFYNFLKNHLKSKNI